MGIDTDVFTYSRKSMFDQRAQFFSNKWFPNQVNGQLNTMNAVTSNYNGVDSPLGFEPQQPMGPFADYGNSTPSRPLSDRRSNSTDTSTDPTPDGPEMDNGNETCLSPGSASICSYAADSEVDNYSSRIGTPNSFVGHRSGSPEMFSDYGANRERLFSTSSSAYFTYSPYTPQDEDLIPSAQVCSPPALNRQTSLAMVEEVLGTTLDDVCTQPMTFFPEEDSPVKPFEEETCLSSNSSLTEHFNASNNNARVNAMTYSQEEAYFSLFCNNGELPILAQCEGSPATESNQSNNNNCNNGDSESSSQSPVSQDVTTTSADVATQPLLASVWSMPRQTSQISDIFTDVMPSNSLDTSEMLQDCLNALPRMPDAKSFPTLNVEILAMQSPLSPAKNDANDEKPTTSRNVLTPSLATFGVKENTKPTTVEVDHNDPLCLRRERNNEACRQSRKRRKNKKLEMEQEVIRFTEENEELRVTIENLEVECKKMRQSIMTLMTQNNSR